MSKRYFRWGGVVPYSWREQGYQTLSEWGSRYVKEITNHSGYQRLSFLMIWNSRSGPAGGLLDCIHISFSYVSILAVNDSQNSLGLQSMRWYWWSRHERLSVISFLSPQHVQKCIDFWDSMFLSFLFSVFSFFFLGGGGEATDLFLRLLFCYYLFIYFLFRTQTKRASVHGCIGFVIPRWLCYQRLTRVNRIKKSEIRVSLRQC